MLTRTIKTLALLLASGLVLTGCGLNPFGAGGLGLDFYAIFAKKMEKPKAIEEEEGGKEGSKKVVKEGVAASGNLAKRAAGEDAEPWIVEQGLEKNGDTLIYFEVVKDKPSEEDPDKIMTGRGEVKFGYSGMEPSTLDDVDTTLITDLYSFHFIGREMKNENWVNKAGEICSLDVKVLFSSTSVNDIKPGKTWFWAMNISPTIEMGKDDTASFILDELDDALKIQYGEGHFLDANSGDNHDEGPRAFDFDLEVHHKNSLEPDKPYHRYQDNEGIVRFSLPWGKDAVDSLYFSIHFYPMYEREGTIQKNGPDGPVLVRFKHNEKSGQGWVTYYNEDGEEVGS
ncbi:hypothetical protein ACFL5V_03720 [Fibrobacterota bacterium]